MTEPAEIAEAKRVLGRRLAAYREAAGLNQHQLAPRVHYGRSTIANVETGRQTCSRAFWERCDTELAAGGALIRAYGELSDLIRAGRVATAHRLGNGNVSGAIAAPPAEDQADNVEQVKRRTALALPALSLFASLSRPGEPWGRLAYALAHPNQLDESTLEGLEWLTGELFRREEHLPARQLDAQLREHLGQLTELLAGAPERFNRRLLITAGETMALAGWIAWDSKDLRRAKTLYDRADQAAGAAGDGPLHACVLAYRSYAAEAGGDLARARRLLSAAQDYVRGEGNATSRAWLAAREAEVDATLGEESLAMRALDRAVTAYDYAHPHRERSWTAFFTPSRLGSMAVQTYARLGHPDLDATAESVLGSLPASDAKTKAVILADVATAVIQCGRHERGANLAHQALDHTLAGEASLGTQRLRSLRVMLRDKRSIPVLVELDDRLLAHVH